MTTRRVSLLVGLLCVVASATAVAQSDPTITGTITGLEICPKDFLFCGDKAWFGGKFVGQVGNKPHTSGSFLVGVSYVSLNDDLDEQITNITGGNWWIVIKQGKQEISGTIQSGTLTYDLETNSFAVVLTLPVTTGTGLVHFKGTLFHEPFPPEIIGMLCQSLCP